MILISGSISFSGGPARLRSRPTLARLGPAGGGDDETVVADLADFGVLGLVGPVVVFREVAETDGGTLGKGERHRPGSVAAPSQLVRARPPAVEVADHAHPPRRF